MKRRWCVLTAKQLLYYKLDTDAVSINLWSLLHLIQTPAGSIDLQSAFEVKQVPASSTFKVVLDVFETTL